MEEIAMLQSQIDMINLQKEYNEANVDMMNSRITSQLEMLAKQKIFNTANLNMMNAKIAAEIATMEHRIQELEQITSGE